MRINPSPMTARFLLTGLSREPVFGNWSGNTCVAFIVAVWAATGVSGLFPFVGVPSTVPSRVLVAGRVLSGLGSLLEVRSIVGVGVDVSLPIVGLTVPTSILVLVAVGPVLVTVNTGAKVGVGSPDGPSSCTSHTAKILAIRKSTAPIRAAPLVLENFIEYPLSLDVVGQNVHGNSSCHTQDGESRDEWATVV